MGASVAYALVAEVSHATKITPTLTLTLTLTLSLTLIIVGAFMGQGLPSGDEECSGGDGDSNIYAALLDLTLITNT